MATEPSTQADPATGPDDGPAGELMAEFSTPGAAPTPWADTLDVLQGAEVFWLSTVRPDGSPHVTPLITVWADGALHFCTGPTERKARNLEHNPGCVLTTGTNRMSEGLDVVLAGVARRVTEEHVLQRLADRWACKYEWHFEVHDGSFWDTTAADDDATGGEGAGEAHVFRVRPATIHAYGRGEDYTSTRWRFEDGASVKA